jgi:hypothetical protein
MTSAELRALAVRYREMAETARTVGLPEILLRIATRYEAVTKGLWCKLLVVVAS